MATYNHAFWSEVVFGKGTTAALANLLNDGLEGKSIYDIVQDSRLIYAMQAAIGANNLGKIAKLITAATKGSALAAVDIEIYLEASLVKANQAVATGQCFAVVLFPIITGLVPFPATESMGCR